MKQIFSDKIINIDNNISDNKFLIKKLNWEKNISSNTNIETLFLSDFLEKKKNLEMLEKSETKSATWWNVYSPEDELEIFKNLFTDALKNNKKIHIVWITLWEEINILEKYYESLGFFSDQINCFEVDFSVPLVTVSIKIENLEWKWSDYKKMWEKIFFNPPIRESGQVKAMFKWINRGVIAWIYIKEFNEEKKMFLEQQLNTEHILPTTLSKVLNYNLADIWFKSEQTDLILCY